MSEYQQPADDKGLDPMDRRLREAGVEFRASSASTLDRAPARPALHSIKPKPVRTLSRGVASRRQQQRRRAHRQRVLTVFGATAGVLAIIGVLVLVSSLRGPAQGDDTPVPAASGPVSATPLQRVPAPKQVIDDATKIPAATFSAVGAGTFAGGPTKISGDPLTVDGKPQVFYYGAEFCPYCAAERWPLVAALSRFGTWSDLQSTTSASQDLFPSTPTFSFHGAKYTSQYVSFEGVETMTNQREGNSYARLETPTAAQTALVTKYNKGGGIPFIDFGNKFMIFGATYDPQVLQGKSLQEIAASLKDPSTDVSKSVLGTANQMTAAICDITSGKPGDVCDAPEIKPLRTQLSAAK